MAYTEFRKSYGDFEVVIPAVDFSELIPEYALRVAEALSNYKLNWVYHLGGVSLEEIIYKQHPRFEISFDPYAPTGQILRQEWCKHMANEIKREFGL